MSIAVRFGMISVAAAGVLAACESHKAPQPAPQPGDTRSPADVSGAQTRGDAGPTIVVDRKPPGPGAVAQTIVTDELLDVGTEQRSFVLAKPTSYSDAKRYPLVLVLHGDGENGALIREAVGFDAVSAQDAIVAYPSGHYGWNLYDPADTDDDVAFLVALVDELKARFSIDPARVFGMGFSSGAFMVNQIACRRPAVFRAIVPHSGGAPSEPRDPTATKWANDYTRCAGQTLGGGPAVMVIHGKDDGLVVYPSGDYTANYWAFIAGCKTTRSVPWLPSPCVGHDECPSDKPVVLCMVSDLGHTLWPSAATAAWDFFRSL